jgi:ParB-like chromosome segregation protein Spo0J
MKWHTEQRVISNLIPLENNPRKLTEKQTKDLTRSIKKFDLVEIPAINLDGTILAGHQRLKIMALLGRGDEIVDVRVPDRKLSKKEAEEYLIRSNKNTGEWDFDLLASGFKQEELQDWGFDVGELKFGTGEETLDEPEFSELSDEKQTIKLSFFKKDLDNIKQELERLRKDYPGLNYYE